MQELRKAALTSPAARWKLRRDKAFSAVFGVVVDFPIGNDTATILCLKDGSTSLYTTSTFGIIGGKAHSSVRKASVALVKLAGSFWSKGKPTKGASYPTSGRVRFTFLGYGGNRIVEAASASIERPQDPYYSLWMSTNRVITELRMITDAAEGR